MISLITFRTDIKHRMHSSFLCYYSSFPKIFLCFIFRSKSYRPKLYTSNLAIFEIETSVTGGIKREFGSVVSNITIQWFFFLYQANTADELPERLIGAVRISHLELKSAIVPKLEPDPELSLKQWPLFNPSTNWLTWVVYSVYLWFCLEFSRGGRTDRSGRLGKGSKRIILSYRSKQPDRQQFLSSNSFY